MQCCGKITAQKVLAPKISPNSKLQSMGDKTVAQTCNPCRKTPKNRDLTASRTSIEHEESSTRRLVPAIFLTLECTQNWKIHGASPMKARGPAFFIPRFACLSLMMP